MRIFFLSLLFAGSSLPVFAALGPRALMCRTLFSTAKSLPAGDLLTADLAFDLNLIDPYPLLRHDFFDPLEAYRSCSQEKMPFPAELWLGTTDLQSAHREVQKNPNDPARHKAFADALVRFLDTRQIESRVGAVAANALFSSGTYHFAQVIPPRSASESTPEAYWFVRLAEFLSRQNPPLQLAFQLRDLEPLSSPLSQQQSLLLVHASQLAQTAPSVAIEQTLYRYAVSQKQVDPVLHKGIWPQASVLGPEVPASAYPDLVEDAFRQAGGFYVSEIGANLHAALALFSSLESGEASRVFGRAGISIREVYLEARSYSQLAKDQADLAFAVYSKAEQMLLKGELSPLAVFESTFRFQADPREASVYCSRQTPTPTPSLEAFLTIRWALEWIGAYRDFINQNEKDLLPAFEWLP